MAIGAEQTEVLETIIVGNAVDVIDLKHERIPAPLGKAAARAPLRQPPRNQTTSKSSTVRERRILVSAGRTPFFR
jgi:hypothetical protein